MKLPVVSGSDVVRAFRKAGYEFDEQHGSHIILRHADPPHGAFPFPTIENCGSRTGAAWRARSAMRQGALAARRVDNPPQVNNLPHARPSP